VRFALLVAVMSLVLAACGGGESTPTPVPRPPTPVVAQIISDQGNVHIPEGVPIGQSGYSPYNSDPPTSGPHWPRPAPRGFYTTTVPDERLVHSLEHGYVIIHYNCAETQCPGLADQLSGLLARYESKVIVNYRPQTRSRIAHTTWTRLMAMDTYDEGRIVAFINAFRGSLAPEPNAP